MISFILFAQKGPYYLFVQNPLIKQKLKFNAGHSKMQGSQLNYCILLNQWSIITKNTQQWIMKDNSLALAVVNQRQGYWFQTIVLELMLQVSANKGPANKIQIKILISDEMSQMRSNPFLISSKIKRMGNNVVFGYWKARGAGQTIRLLLAYLKVQFQEVQYPFEESDRWFKKQKMSLGFEFPNLPYLIEDDFKLTQASAIVSYIVEKTGKSELLGKNIEDVGAVNNIIGVSLDTRKDLLSLFMNKDYEKVKAPILEKIRPRLESLQKFVGDKPFALGYLTYADFFLAEQLYYFETMFPGEKQNYPFWSRIRHNFESLPEIRAYYQRPNAMIQPFLPPMAVVQPKLAKVKLGYWKIRGRGQVPRLLLAYSGIDFEDYQYGLGEPKWPEDKKKMSLNFPNLPYLTDGDYNITESSAIPKYIVSKWGKGELLGKDVREKAKIESFISIFNQTAGAIKQLFMNPDNQTAKVALLQKYGPKLQQMQAFVGQKGFVFGSLTLADFYVAEESYYIETIYPQKISGWPFLKRIRNSFNSLPQITAYYRSSKSFKGEFLPPMAAVKINIPSQFK